MGIYPQIVSMSDRKSDEKNRRDLSADDQDIQDEENDNICIFISIVI